MTSKETLERLGNEKIVVKGNWKGTIGQKPQYDHLTTFKEYFKNEYATILKALERLEELENDRLLDRTEKEELERVNKVLNHNLEEKVEVIADLEKENQELKKPKFDLSLLDNAKKIEVDYNEELLEKIKILEKENEKLKARCKAIPPLVIKNEKLIKAIEILKEHLYVKELDIDYILEFSSLYSNHLTKLEYEVLNEVFGE